MATPYLDPNWLAQALGVRPVASPTLTPSGTFTGGGESPDIGPVEGQGTASPEAQGVSGRAALASSLASKTGIATLGLNLMGQLAGPIGALAMSGLKAAMTAHNAVALAQAYEQLTPQQRAELSPEEAFALANPDPFTNALSQFFGFGPLAIADPLGQKESQAYQLQRALERSLRPNAAENEGFGGLGPVDPSAAPPGTLAEGLASGALGGGVPGGPSAPSAPSDSGGFAEFDQGGYVPHRLKASLAGGEYVIKAAVVKRHRKLLEHINAKAK